MDKKVDSRTLLSAAAVAGVIGVGVSGYFAGMKAQKITEFKEGEKGDTLSKKETMIITLECAWPTLLIGFATGGAIIGSHHLATKNIEALTIAYTTTAAMLEAHQKTELVKFGTEVANEIKEEVGKECLLPERTSLNTCGTKKGETDYLCFDDFSGRYFWSNEDKIEASFIKTSRLLFESVGNSATVNDLYDFLDIPQAGCGMAWGWDLEFDNENVKEYIHYETYPSRNKNGEPCLALVYHPLQIVPF